MNDDGNAVPPPVDLSALDPSTEPDRMDALVSAIVRDGMDARRAGVSAGVVRQAAHWAFPAVAAAAVVLAVSVPTLVSMRPPTTTTAPSTVVADTVAAPARLGLPESVVALTGRDQAPTPAEIVAAFNLPSRQANQ